MTRLNHSLERLMPVLTPLGVVVGLLLSDHLSRMRPAVFPLFGFMTFTSALSISIADLGRTLKKPKSLLVFLLCSTILAPLFTFLLSSLCFHGQADVICGFMLLSAIPTAVVGTVWSSIYRGSGAISLTLLLAGTFLAPVLTPLIIRIFMHASIEIDSLGMMRDLLFMVVIPSVLGVTINQATKGSVTRSLVPCLKPLGKICLLLVVSINTSKVACAFLDDVSWLYVPIILVSIILTVAVFPLSLGLSRLFRFTREETISITFASSLRNISAALVLATDFFPPTSSLPVIFGIVFQQTICAIMASLLFGNHEKPSLRKEIQHAGHS